MITGCTQASLDSAAERFGRNAIAVRSEAPSMLHMETLAERVKAEFGTLDFLFVNSGVTRFIPFDPMPEEWYDEILAVNAKGPYFNVQKLALLIRQDSATEATEVATELATPGRRNGDQA